MYIRMYVDVYIYMYMCVYLFISIYVYVYAMASLHRYTVTRSYTPLAHRGMAVLRGQEQRGAHGALRAMI